MGRLKRSLFRSLRTLTWISLGLSIHVLSCSEPFVNRDPSGESFPQVRGQSLDGKTWNLPSEFAQKESVVLLGYVQDAQFDIDRWLIGLDMRSAEVAIYELPTIKGMIPRLISEKINQGMRSGIPQELWGGVITLYEDGEKVQRFTGNERPRNARVILLDREGTVRFFADEGFSVPGLNRLLSAIKASQFSSSGLE